MKTSLSLVLILLASSLSSSCKFEKAQAEISSVSKKAHLEDPRWGYSFYDWCKRLVPDMTEDERLTRRKMLNEIAGAGGTGNCEKKQDFLENKLVILNLKGLGILDL